MQKKKLKQKILLISYVRKLLRSLLKKKLLYLSKFLGFYKKIDKLFLNFLNQYFKLIKFQEYSSFFFKRTYYPCLSLFLKQKQYFCKNFCSRFLLNKLFFLKNNIKILINYKLQDCQLLPTKIFLKRLNLYLFNKVAKKSLLSTIFLKKKFNNRVNLFKKCKRKFFFRKHRFFFMQFKLLKNRHFLFGR